MARGWRFPTLVARGGQPAPGVTRPLTPPIYQTSVFVFDDLERVDAVWEGREPGFIYGRFGTPNHAELEETVARLEGAEAAVATASGMGALTALFLATLAPGDHLVAGRDLYGATAALLREELARAGVEVSLVDAADPDAVEAALTGRTRAIFAETVSNPLLRLADLPALAALARGRGLQLLVDNTFASPALLRPLGLGATAVVHSATKYLAGHGDTTAGVVAGPRSLMERVRKVVIRMGLNLGPFDAWLTQRGLRTLALRMERQSANALALARFLEGRPEVARVFYLGLESHPQRALARRLFPDGAGGMVAFELRGGAEAVRVLMKGLRLIEFAPSFGDVATTWSYPARTSHRSLGPEERKALGIGDGLVRLSVGIEAVEDLTADLGGALDRLT